MDIHTHTTVGYAVSNCANTAERLEVLLGMEPLRDPRNIVLDETPDFHDGLDAAFAELLWLLVLFLDGFYVTGSFS